MGSTQQEGSERLFVERAESGEFRFARGSRTGIPGRFRTVATHQEAAARTGTGLTGQSKEPETAVRASHRRAWGRAETDRGAVDPRRRVRPRIADRVAPVAGSQLRETGLGFVGQLPGLGEPGQLAHFGILGAGQSRQLGNALGWGNFVPIGDVMTLHLRPLLIRRGIGALTGASLAALLPRPGHRHHPNPAFDEIAA